MTETGHIDSTLPGTFPALRLPSKGANTEGGTGFSDLLAQMVGKVQELGVESDRLSVDLALGRPVELHQVMLAATKAQLALELLIELRNKIIEAYQEISRMPV
jgi:flagellar hook-basal body complex protein FliE